ncbi:hypothetical protein E3U43_004971, partial [Larimichthys crocea]
TEATVKTGLWTRGCSSHHCRTQMMIVRRESMETITADEAEGNNKGTALAAWRGEAARWTGGEEKLKVDGEDKHKGGAR